MYPSAAIEVLLTQEDRAMQCTLEKSSLMTLAHYLRPSFKWDNLNVLQMRNFAKFVDALRTEATLE